MTEREIEHERKYHYYKGYRKGVLTTLVLLSFLLCSYELLYYYLYGGNK
jgi:hypothetical protein